MNLNIPGVNRGFGATGYTGNNYMDTFNSWGIGGSPDVPNIMPGDGVTQFVNPAVYANPNPVMADTGGGWFDNAWTSFKNLPWLDRKNASGAGQQGMLSPTIAAISAFGNGYMAMKHFGLAEKQFNFQKQAYNQNYAAQRQATNARLEDRQRARVASNPSAYESVSDYMNKYGIK